MIKIFLILLCGFLWGFAGAKGTSKAWRRIGVPLVVTIFAFIESGNLWVLLIFPLMFSALSVGYGIPSK